MKKKKGAAFESGVWSVDRGSKIRDRPGDKIFSYATVKPSLDMYLSVWRFWFDFLSILNIENLIDFMS